MDRGIIDVSPDWGMDAVLGPDRLVRKADLTANHSLAPCLAEAANRSSDPVGLAQAYVAIVLRQRSDLAMFIERRQDFAGDLVRYRGAGGRHGHRRPHAL